MKYSKYLIPIVFIISIQFAYCQTEGIEWRPWAPKSLDEMPPQNLMSAVDTLEEGIYKTCINNHDSNYRCCGIFTKEKVLIPFIFNQLPDEYSDFMPVRVSKGTYDLEALLEDTDFNTSKMGFINSKGKPMFPFEYDLINTLNKSTDGAGKYYSATYTGDSPIAAHRTGLITKKNKVVMPFEYNAIYDFKSGMVKLLKIENGLEKFGIADLKGNIIQDCKYNSDFQEINENVFKTFIYKRDGRERYEEKFGCVDGKGNVLIDFLFKSLELSRNKELLIGNMRAMGIIYDLEGKKVFENPKGQITEIEEGIYRVAKNNKYGIVNHKFKEISEVRYTNITVLSSNYFLVEESIPREKRSPLRLYGVINSKGKQILPSTYKEIIFVNKNLIFAKGEGPLYIQFNGNGKQIRETDYVFLRKGGACIVGSKKGSMLLGVLDLKGIPITDFKYADFYGISGNLEKARFKLGEELVVINEKGEEIERSTNFSGFFGSYESVSKLQARIASKLKGKFYQFKEFKGREVLLSFDLRGLENGKLNVFVDSKEGAIWEFEQEIEVNITNTTHEHWLWIKGVGALESKNCTNPKFIQSIQSWAAIEEGGYELLQRARPDAFIKGLKAWQVNMSEKELEQTKWKEIILNWK